MLRWKWVPVEREGNAAWPLPPDYVDLTDEGQRLARVNATLMQHDPGLATESWLWFCRCYLMPDPAADFNPGFYAPPIREFGFVHPMVIRGIEANRRCVISLPRGSAKTTTLQSYMLFKTCTHTQYRIRFYKSTRAYVEEDITAIRDQLERNQRLIDDFGDIVPGRREGVWSHEKLRTATLVRIVGQSVGARKLRGGRAELIVLDDPEYDPDNPLQSDVEVDRLARKITRVLLPMLDRDEDTPSQSGRFVYLGTPIHKRSLHYTLIAPDVLLPDRPAQFRDALWYKINVPAKLVQTQPDGSSKVVRAWSKFSDAFLDEQRELLTDAGYGSEYGGDPVSSDKCIFELRPSLHEYHLEAADLGAVYEQPFDTPCTVHWHECYGVEPVKTTPRSAAFSDHIRAMYRFVTVDYAYTAKTTSDWSVVHVMGVDRRNDLWSLDMWRGRVKFPFLVGQIWRLALKWHVMAVGVEAYPVQEEYYQQAAAYAEHIYEQYGFCPPCIPIKPPIDKGQRIMRLAFRVERGKLKLPAHRRYQPPYYQLYQQIRDFTEDLANLPHDDELDTLSMSADILRGRSKATPAGPTPATPLEQINQGQLIDDSTGISWLRGLSFDRIPAIILNRLMDDQVASKAEQYRRAAEDPATAALHMLGYAED